MTMTFSPISQTDSRWAGFKVALMEAGLATDDLLEPGQRFYAFADGKLIGFGGYCCDGPEALLRSVIVAPERRGVGEGRRIIAALLDRLREDGAKRVWLLTTTAQQFFAQLGFVAQSRDAAPEAIAGTREFSTLCPASAVLMCLDLA
jgi:N-acetylglutamate synthase-like GNAT family acetyltransferase